MLTDYYLVSRHWLHTFHNRTHHSEDWGVTLIPPNNHFRYRAQQKPLCRINYVWAGSGSSSSTCQVDTCPAGNRTTSHQSLRLQPTSQKTTAARQHYCTHTCAWVIEEVCERSEAGLYLFRPWVVLLTSLCTSLRIKKIIIVIIHNQVKSVLFK